MYTTCHPVRERISRGRKKDSTKDLRYARTERPCIYRAPTPGGGRALYVNIVLGYDLDR